MPYNSGRPDYHAYIQSPQWRQKANDAKRRAGYRCQVCNKSSSEIVLDAHHRTYERLGNERPEDITVLCRNCHELYETHKSPKKTFASSVTVSPAKKRNDNSGCIIFGVFAAIILVFFWGVLSNGPSKKQASQTSVKLTTVSQTVTTGNLTLLSKVTSESTPDAIATIRQRATSVGAPTAQPTLVSKQSATNRDSNLRAGPGTEYNIIGLARKGQAVTVVGCAKSCSWYMLSDSKWIAAYLVDNATGSYVSVSPPPLPKEPPLPTTALVAPAPQATATPAPQATATPVPTVAPQACVIKGNISYNTGEKIYHVPGQAYYDDTVINEAYGERWFCSEQEAQAAGWRKAKR